MTSKRGHEILLSISEMEWVNTALDKGISYRNAEDAKKIVKDWEDFLEIVDAKNLLVYASSEYVILSRTMIWDRLDSEIDLW